jgi:tRNA(Ile)-lysidine synthase
MLKSSFLESNLNNNINYCVGLSGGVDSVVLLHSLCSISKLKNVPLANIQALHVNHGISALADQWQLFCENYCQQLGVKLTIVKLSVQKIGGQGLENSARKARSKIFSKIKDVDTILLAHHLDDQYETMLTQIMRGSDLHNVAAMDQFRIFANKKLWRPLIQTSKFEIVQYATENKLQYIEDDSNGDDRYLRNFLRNNIIPKLKQYDDKIYNKFNQYLNNVKYHVQLIDELAAVDLLSCQQGNKISWDNFQKLSINRQTNLLAYFLKTKCSIVISHKSIKEFIRQCLEVNTNLHGGIPIIEIGGITLICKNHYIYLL